MKSIRVLLAVAMAIISVNVYADTKIAYIQLEKIMASSPKASEISKKMESEFAPRQAELRAMGQQIQAQSDALNSEAIKLSESERQAREQAISNKNIEFQRKQRELSEDVDLRRNQELSGLQEIVRNAINSVAQAENYDLVMVGQAAYVGKAVDVTDKVIKAMNK